MQGGGGVFELVVRTEFAAAHRLLEYEGRCSLLHGHTWVVEVYVAGEHLDRCGMLIDFQELKEMVNETVEKFDHRYLNEVPPFSDRNPLNNPTVENLARFIYQELKQKISSRRKDLILSKVQVWESPRAAATYREGSAW